MSITIIKEPTGIYPAYNNSYIQFSSDLADNNRASINVLPASLFPNPFVIYPDLNGVYVFNLKEAVKTLFNINGFTDQNVFTDSYYKSIEGLYEQLSIRINVISDLSYEYIDKVYDFCKCAKQIGDFLPSNEFQLLTYSKDGVNNSITYFEGFPFAFDILKATAGEDVKIKSLNTGDELTGATPTTSDSFRFNVDKGGGNNWNSDNVLPLIEGVNRLEIYGNDVFKTNLLLTKKKQCSGVYLKWFNNNSGYSYFLFNKYFTENTKTDELGIVLNSDFDNIGDSIGNFKSAGKNSIAELNLKASFNHEEYEVLRSLFESPSVQMYTSQTAYVEGKFIDVSIDGDFPFNNKKAFNKISFAVIPPKRITPTL